MYAASQLQVLLGLELQAFVCMAPNFKNTGLEVSIGHYDTFFYR